MQLSRACLQYGALLGGQRLEFFHIAQVVLHLAEVAHAGKHRDSVRGERAASRIAQEAKRRITHCAEQQFCRWGRLASPPPLTGSVTITSF